MVWVVWGLRNHGGNACLHACLQPAEAQIVASPSSTPHRQRQPREVPATHLDLEGPRVLGQHNLPSRVHCLHILHRVAAAQAGAGGRAEAACRWGGRGQQGGGQGERCRGVGQGQQRRLACSTAVGGLSLPWPEGGWATTRGGTGMLAAGSFLTNCSPEAKHSQYILRHMLRLQLQGRWVGACAAAVDCRRDTGRAAAAAAIAAASAAAWAGCCRGGGGIC